MINVPADERLWSDVESTLWQLDREGYVIPLTDVLIACSARRINALVLTYDSHFTGIPGVRVADRLEN